MLGSPRLPVINPVAAKDVGGGGIEMVKERGPAFVQGTLHRGWRSYPLGGAVQQISVDVLKEAEGTRLGTAQ